MSIFYYFLAKLSFNENIYCQAFNLKAYGFVFIQIVIHVKV